MPEAALPKPNDAGMPEEGTTEAAAPPKPGEAPTQEGIYSTTGQAAGPRRRLRRRPRKSWANKIAVFTCKTVLNFIASLICLFLLWSIYYRPYKVRPHIDAAALAVFDLASPAAGNATATATALRYDLALNMSFFNDHRVYSIRFGHLTVGLYYGGDKLGPSDDTLPSYKLRTRRHRTVYPALRGRASNVSAAVAEAFARERAAGAFNLDVRVKTTLTYRFWPTKTTHYYEYDCWLQFAPPPGNGTPAVTGGVKCGKHK